MDYARYNGRVTDAAGNLILAPTVEVRRMTLGMPRAVLFSDRAGENQLPNPFTLNAVTDKGRIAFHAAGGAYQIKVTSAAHPGFEDIIDWVPLGNLAEMDFGMSGLLEFNWDAVVANIAGRQQYDGLPKGFSVLVESDSGHSNLPYVYYKLSDVGGDLPGVTGANIGNMTGGGGLAAAFDGVAAQVLTAGAVLANSASAGTIGKDWGAGTPRIISKAVLTGPSDAPIARNTSNVATSVNAKLQGSNDNSAWTDLDTKTTGTGNGAVITFSAVSTTAYRYHRIEIAAADSSSDKHAAEVVFHQAGDWSAGLMFPAMRLEAALSLRLNSNGSVIANGAAHNQPVPFRCKVIGWRLTGDGIGSISIDLKVGTYANWPSGLASITAGNPMAISSARKAEDTALSGWSTTLEAGRMLQFDVLSCVGLTDVTVTLFLQRL